MVNGLDTLSLIKRAQDNDNVAKQLLIEKNSPLIKSVIRRYKGKGVEYDDLYQLGSLGFLKAVINFNDEFNVKFSTYAVPMIAGEVKRYLRDNGIIKVSRGVKALSIQITKFVDDYYNLIHRHNITYYYLLKVNGYGTSALEEQEKSIIKYVKLKTVFPNWKKTDGKTTGICKGK